MMKKMVLVITLTVVSLLLAEVPHEISYQGRITDAGGPVADGNYPIVFSLYDVDAGGAAIWTETHPSVEVNDGLYNVMLGSITPFPGGVDFSQQYWLEVEFDGSVLGPRYQLGASPYALNIASLDASDGEILKYNGAAGKWEPGTDETGSGGTGGVGGSGTDNYLPRWNGTTDLENSSLYQKDGGNLGIGTTDPSARLDIVNAPGTGLRIDSAGYDGIYVANADTAGIRIDCPKGDPATAIDIINGQVISKWSPAGWGHYSFEIWNIMGSSWYSDWIGVGDANGMFVSVASDTPNCSNTAISAGASSSAGANCNIGIKAYASGADSNYAIYAGEGWAYFADRVGIGTKNPASMLEIKNAVVTGLIIDTASVDGIFMRNLGNDGIVIDQASDDGIEIKNSGSCGLYAHDVDHNGVYVSNAGHHGIEVDAAGWAGIYISEPAANGIDINASSTTPSGIRVFSHSGTYPDTGIVVNDCAHWEGYFRGAIYANNASAGIKAFLIDHPSDPKNKLLRHYCVESPEALVTYRGTAKLESSGKVEVQMPTYFKDLADENDVTVTLTPIGQTPFLASYVWDSDRAVVEIYGDPNRDVSYQVSAERDDPVKRLLEQPVEELKGPGATCGKGKYLLPEAYNRIN